MQQVVLPLQFVKIPDINLLIFLQIWRLHILCLSVFTKCYGNSRFFRGFWHIYCYLGGRVNKSAGWKKLAWEVQRKGMLYRS